jgi:hypothetical protein
MRLCPRCNKRLRASRRMRDEFDSLDDNYDLFDEEVDALIDEAGPPPPPPSDFYTRLDRLLENAEDEIGDALRACVTGRPLFEIRPPVDRAIENLTAAETEAAGHTRVLRWITRAISILRFARAVLGLSRANCEGNLQNALGAVRWARRALGLPQA